ncbi:hypothetical protein HMPREF3193_00111 [Bifidobacterium breve]|nr:hypothetical protein HMPREF3193_00111 [Bifidobacterium breve]
MYVVRCEGRCGGGSSPHDEPAAGTPGARDNSGARRPPPSRFFSCR